MTDQLFLEIEADLDEEIVEDFTTELESAINSVMLEHDMVDSRAELLTVLSTFAVQVAIDVGVEEERFLALSKELYTEISKLFDQEKERNIDLSELN